jgi:aerobic carbon-monoxide dehydrogenase small subunit
MKMTRTITFTINGKTRKEPVEANTLLVNLIRERLSLTGTKYACGIGECGACTVLINGKPVLSCLTLAAEADGKDIVTIEGLNDKISTVLRETFLEEGAVQCGFCTPGFLVMSSYLLKEKPKPTEDEVKKYIKGNLCRCTGYIGVIRAIMKASEKLNN